MYVYWDNPDEIIGYVTERWADFVQMGDDVQQVTHTAWAAASAGRPCAVEVEDAPGALAETIAITFRYF